MNLDVMSRSSEESLVTTAWEASRSGTDGPSVIRRGRGTQGIIVRSSVSSRQTLSRRLASTL